MKFIPSISSLAPNYDAFILDLWGVIHDGKVAYPGVHECLEQLKKSGKKIILLSNAPRRAETVSRVMDCMGIERNLYDAIITSGEAAHRALEKPNAAFTPETKNYVYLGLEKDRRIIEDLGYIEVSEAADASFALVSHSTFDNQPMDEIMPFMQDCYAAKLPMLCINPDMEVVRTTGERVACAGLIALQYERMGGKVIYFGKPHELVYAACFDLLPSILKNKILAIGDSPRTDIAGANKVGIDSVIVTGGILHIETGDAKDADYMKKVGAIMAQAQVKADMVLERFNW